MTLAEAIALALRTSPDLAAAARELNIARAEIERANYTSQFNPYLDSLGDYRMRAGTRTRRIGASVWPRNWRFSDSRPRVAKPPNWAMNVRDLKSKTRLVC